MPTLHLLHGLPGSGKTTFAKRLARELNAVRITPDEWMVSLYGTNPPVEVFRSVNPKIEELIWVLTERMLVAGVDVILDIGYWERAGRDKARLRARALGVTCRFYALQCAPDEARRRVLARTALMPPNTLEITGPTFDYLASQLDSMGEDEEHIVVRSPPPDFSE